MGELQNRLASFIRIEEGMAYYRGQKEEVEPSARGGREGKGDQRTFGRVEG